MADLLLGIDVGTGSTKGVLTDLAGQVLATHVVEHAMEVPRPGWAEQDADAVWWNDVVTVCRTLLDGPRFTGSDVAAVAISAIGPCLLPLDEHGVPLRKGILYGVDTRASEEIALLDASLGADEVFAFSGMAFTSQAIGPKMLWLQRHEPDVWARTRHVTTASSYLVYRLTDEHVIDRHTASHYVPFFELATLAWSPRFADAVAPLTMLPRLAWSDEVAGTITGRAAAETGLRVGTPVAVGTVDALAEALSVGVNRPGDLMVMYGSTTFFILMQPEPTPDPRTWTTAGPFAGQYALAAGMSTTGSLTRWFRDELARDLPVEEAFVRLHEGASHVPAGSDGLMILPYFSGERTPLNDPHARGVVAGLSLAHTREHLFRATLEGIAYGVRHNLETFEQIGAHAERIVAVGGGARGLGVQTVSDVTGRPQTVPRVTLGACYGDAFLAGLAAGRLERRDLDDWVTEAASVEPDPAVADLHDTRYQDFLSLYEGTRFTVHRLVASGSRQAARRGGPG